ncbi:MAG TPA: GNAT family N-acetyltransferase [Acidimicrobiales bacterium]|nr:GNAT family N-acetyltransferase [Acidimicrobiales bacterium]
MDFRLATDRLTLRPMGAEDASWNLDLLEEHSGQREWSVEEERLRLAQRQTEALDGGIGLLAIEIAPTGLPVGYCGLILGRTGWDEPEIAYEILPAYRGVGYATEAARAVVGAATRTGRRRLWASVGDWNTPSFRVLEKLSFRRDRVTTDEQGRGLVYMVRDLSS